ncbi:MAG: aminotransferase class I/II-fold pyridoxal phosphate-dependent enzyme [Paracoccaceae bacterium]
MMKNKSFYTILSTSTLRSVLKKIDQNALGFCAITNIAEEVIGLITDGDIRRHIISGGDLNTTVAEIMITDFFYGTPDDSYVALNKMMSDKIKFIPILDESKKFINVVTQTGTSFLPILEPDLGHEELENVQRCFATNWISSNGAFVAEFEENFSKLHNKRHALAVSNGTVALHLALVALGIGPGDDVIVPTLTFAASAAAIVQAGARPVFCECDDALCIDPQAIEELITDNTKAVIAVHLYGRVADMALLGQICEKFGLILIEDSAEAIGSTFNGELTGTFGDASTFSFFGNKTITTGEGGMILFKDENTFQKAQILRDHGMSKSKRYWHDHIGFNYRLTNMQAAVGVAQLKKLDSIITKKRDIMFKYIEYCANNKYIAKYSQERTHEKNSNWLFYVIFNDEINVINLAKFLHKRQIDTRPIFYPLHWMPPYNAYPRSKCLKRSTYANKHGICLPSSPSLSNENLERIISVLDEGISLVRNKY